jgi:hypothetical protein
VPNITTDATPFIVAVWAVATIVFLVVWKFHRKKRPLPKQIARFVPYRRTRFVPFQRKSVEQQRSELLDRQLEAVMQKQVTFSKSPNIASTSAAVSQCSQRATGG